MIFTPVPGLPASLKMMCSPPHPSVRHFRLQSANCQFAMINGQFAIPHCVLSRSSGLFPADGRSCSFLGARGRPKIMHRGYRAASQEGPTMLAKFCGGILAIILAVTVALPLRAEVTAAAVDASIKQGVDYLLSRQDRAIGAWAEYKGEPGGLTAM